MQEHYQLSDEAFTSLINEVTIADLVNAVPLFDPYETQEPINKVGLLYYIDAKGDFRSPPLYLPHKKIAHAVYETLSDEDKLMVMMYIDREEIDNDE